MRKKGFVIEQAEGNQWRVVQRPAAEQPKSLSSPSSDLPKLISTTVNGVNHIDFAPETMADVLRKEFERQNMLLDAMVKSIQHLQLTMNDVAQVIRKAWK